MPFEKDKIPYRRNLFLASEMKMRIFNHLWWIAWVMAGSENRDVYYDSNGSCGYIELEMIMLLFDVPK